MARLTAQRTNSLCMALSSSSDYYPHSTRPPPLFFFALHDHPPPRPSTLFLSSLQSPLNPFSPPLASLPPLPHLPSPLLCPRRTFLACLILTSTWPTPTASISMFLSTHAASSRTSSCLRRSTTMPELEPTSRESIMSYSDETMLVDLQGDLLPMLVAEPDVDDFSMAAGCSIFTGNIMYTVICMHVMTQLYL